MVPAPNDILQADNSLVLRIWSSFGAPTLVILSQTKLS